MELWITAIGTIGFPSCIALYLLWKRDEDKKIYVDMLDKKDEENRQDTKKQIEELKQENKEEKEMFKSALNSFRLSVEQSQILVQEVYGIKGEIKEMNKDISIIKDRISK